jgi:hypothetical protein
MSFSDIAHVLNGLGHDVEIRQVPPEVYAGFFPGAFEMMEMMRYWTEYTYFGPDAEAKIALARKVSTAPAMSFSAWAKRNMPAAELA